MKPGRGNESNLDHTIEPPNGWAMIRGPVVINGQDAALLHDLGKRATGIAIEESEWALK
jgi:hypothetical protein